MVISLILHTPVNTINLISFVKCFISVEPSNEDQTFRKAIAHVTTIAGSQYGSYTDKKYEETHQLLRLIMLHSLFPPGCDILKG